MLLAVDPDVFNATKRDLCCNFTVINLAARVEEDDVLFAVDGAAIEREYVTLLFEYYKAGRQREHVPRLLTLALGPRKKRISPSPSNTLQAFLSKTPDCAHPVEPELLGMAEKEPTLCLLLAGDVPGVRPRGLVNPTIRRELLLCIGDRDVRFATDTVVEAEPFRVALPKQSLGLWFQDAVALYLQGQEPDLRCIAAPRDIYNRQKCKEQIDLYGYRKVERGRALVVGECKLPEEGHNRLLLWDDIKQVLRKLMAAVDYEWQKTGSDIVQLEAVIVSTAQGFGDTEEMLITSAQRYLNQDYSDVIACVGIKFPFPLRFMQARLRQNFLRQKKLEVVGMGTWRTWSISCQHEGQGSVRWQIQTLANR